MLQISCSTTSQRCKQKYSNQAIWHLKPCHDPNHWDYIFSSFCWLIELFPEAVSWGPCLHDVMQCDMTLLPNDWQISVAVYRRSYILTLCHINGGFFSKKVLKRTKQKYWTAYMQIIIKKENKPKKHIYFNFSKSFKKEMY